MTVLKQKVVLDTSLFVNPAAAHVFGNNPTSCLISFLEKARLSLGVEFLMPPSIYAELMHFAEENRIPKELLLVLHQTPPKKNEIKIPAIFIYELVESMRDRIDRGLRLAERHAREALMSPAPAQKTHGPGPKPDSEMIGRLRESYRRIMREGSLDSKADVDLLLLAYESNAILISADQGVLLWAENLGITILPHDQLLAFLNSNKLSASDPA